ncbi:MAG: SIS domain-containing protein [Promethearchaeota archaeon]
MNNFLKEIFSQPQALLETLNYIRNNYQIKFQNLRERIVKKEISNIIFTGMGSSYFSSYIPYYLLNQNGINAEMRESGEFLLYSFPEKENKFFKNTIIIIISQSGESGEIIKILNRIDSLKNKPYLIGITNSPKSTLAQKSNITFLIRAGKETSVTSKSYTCTLLMLYIFAKSLFSNFFANQDNLLEIKRYIEEIRKFLEDKEKIDIFYNNLISFYGINMDCLEILARGPSLATAYQSALNYKEIVKKCSEANTCSTFRHGGIECLNKNSKLIIISSDQKNFNLNLNFIKKMLTKWECGKILHITNQENTYEDTILKNNPKIIDFKHDISNPFLSPIMEIIILQLFFYKIAELKRIIPGEFYFSQKITRDI